MLYNAVYWFYMLYMLSICFHTLLNTFIRFSYTFICFSYAFICFLNAFICIQMLLLCFLNALMRIQMLLLCFCLLFICFSYAFIRFSYTFIQFSYAFIRFLYAFIRIQTPLYAFPFQIVVTMFKKAKRPLTLSLHLRHHMTQPLRGW